MATRILQYTVHAALVGTSTKVFSYRCSECRNEFHIDFRPLICPVCGARFGHETEMGVTPTAETPAAKGAQG